MNFHRMLRAAAIFVITLVFLVQQGRAATSVACSLAKANYPITKVGTAMLEFDYNRITQPGIVPTVRIPGIIIIDIPDSIRCQKLIYLDSRR
jgi:hypothetical protein